MTARGLAIPLTILVFAVNPGCLCTNAAQQLPFRAHVGDNYVNCVCNAFLKVAPNGLPTPVQLCLPPELNLGVAEATNNPAAPGLADMGDEEFARRVNSYCQH